MSHFLPLLHCVNAVPAMTLHDRYHLDILKYSRHVSTIYTCLCNTTLQEQYIDRYFGYAYVYIYSVCVCVYIKTYSLCNVCTEMVFVFEYIPIHETLDTSGRGYYVYP